MDKVCIVIPCYNEQHRLQSSEYTNFYNDSDFHFLFVNDGSTDFTLKILNKINKFREDRISILNMDKNQGKGEAVRRGVLYADSLNKYSIIGFLDADLSTPLTEIPNLISHFKKEELFIFGSRFKRIGVDIKRKVYRHYLGRIFATLASNMLEIPVYDTQCGAKFFKSEVVEFIFTDHFKSNWTFDLEIFYRFLNKYDHLNLNSIAKEIPLEKWEDKDGSKIRFKHFVKVPFDLIRLYFFYNIKKD